MQIAIPKFSLHLSFQGDKAWQGALKHLFLNFHQQGHEVSYPVSMHIKFFSIAEISLKLYITKRKKRKKSQKNKLYECTKTKHNKCQKNYWYLF